MSTGYFAHPTSVIDSGCQIGNNVKIWHFCHVSPGCCAINRKQEFKQTLVKKGATIGANATIVCGVEIGEYAFIGAGTVVTKPVQPYALVVGNPGKQIGWMSESGNRLFFDAEGIAKCSISNNIYQLTEKKVVKLSVG
ncbi:MAG: N-acetyltransferase [Chitinophagaceae bacterium]|nr:MAG: N-acetyltransferase [Chitinophagaceae bacterium]